MGYNEISIQYYSSPMGELILGSYRDMLCVCDWRYRKMRKEIDDRITQGLSAEYVEEKSPLNEKMAEQLKEYFEGTRKSFDIPLLFIGTEFQRRVWENLKRLDYGSTTSYIEFARSLGNEKAIRAVAAAVGANAHAIVVPCHRVVGSKGELTGYAGGLEAKSKLLKLEGRDSDARQLEIF